MSFPLGVVRGEIPYDAICEAEEVRRYVEEIADYLE